MVYSLMGFPTIEETLETIERNRNEINYLERKLVELKKAERMIKAERMPKNEYRDRSGVTYEDLFGEIKAAEIKQKISDKLRGTRSGKNNPSYKHGQTGFHSNIRRMAEYKQWRSSVCQRDNWTCQTCGVRGERLDVHHIIPFIGI